MISILKSLSLIYSFITVACAINDNFMIPLEKKIVKAYDNRKDDVSGKEFREKSM
ncbi:hypothetical protein HMPREF1011_00525 [Anaerostipes caccae]|uniref:Lipoprotein n=1 Tax=Anaerostipes caccae (strain DSM 14662 / CCUG 47493 / JCM 13470 / NCIMB 13811 / L1-92) TaxID=411490 RepID=B0MBS7_ANACD|nr:hypothetical protein ANACAC_01098 [Anaerostipes caccae L1-92]EFV23664.1 hypothetical protein HMPREF1011_00525 [Anaerostipes caccae]